MSNVNMLNCVAMSYTGQQVCNRDKVQQVVLEPSRHEPSDKKQLYGIARCQLQMRCKPLPCGAPQASNRISDDSSSCTTYVGKMNMESHVTLPYLEACVECTVQFLTLLQRISGSPPSKESKLKTGRLVQPFMLNALESEAADSAGPCGEDNV
eukprot:1972656-Amphidinium_carterae.1